MVSFDGDGDNDRRYENDDGLPSRGEQHWWGWLAVGCCNTGGGGASKYFRSDLGF